MHDVLIESQKSGDIPKVESIVHNIIALLK